MPPYTLGSDRVEKMFLSLTNAFCIAQMHGSIIQTVITRERMISIYSMLCTFFDDHDLSIEYIRLLIINRDFKQIDNVIRARNQLIDSLNDHDIDSILKSIDNIPDLNHKTMSRYLIASRLGYYMNDDAFSSLYSGLISHVDDWVHDEKRMINYQKYVFDFLRNAIKRIRGNDIVNLICEIFAQKLAKFYYECYKILGEIDSSGMEESDQLRIKSLLIEVMDKEDYHPYDSYISSAILRFCKTSTIPYEDLEQIISQKYPPFYNDTFLLEMSVLRRQEKSVFIERFLSEAQSRNKTQGVNGVYADYGHESLDVVYRILKADKAELDAQLCQRIIDVSIETLAIERNTIPSKISAINLLQYAYFHSDNVDVWESVFTQLEDNHDTFSIGQEIVFGSKETNDILSFKYDLFVGIHKDVLVDQLIERMYSEAITDSYTSIRYLDMVFSFIKDSPNSEYSENLITAILFFAIEKTQDCERDVRYRATICLVELTRFIAVSHLALMHLSGIMDLGSQAEKIAILNRISDIVTDDNQFVKQIVDKGKADSNYLVRSVAMSVCSH